ncbi:MAG: hypothetical protein KBD78_05670 [Oligoflexales bacterium]|nr:hypothetical protein [Oligoflexales bacterium]
MIRLINKIAMFFIFIFGVASCRSSVDRDNEQSQLANYQALTGTRCEKVAKLGPEAAEKIIEQLCESPKSILEFLVSTFIRGSNVDDNPSSATQDHNERFENLSKFLTSSQNGTGISIGANANLSSGLLQYEAELGYQNGELALFCSVGAGALVGLSAVSAGVSSSMGLVKRIGCSDHNAYKGGFLSMGISGGASAGLGVNGQILLNFGVSRLSELPALFKAKLNVLKKNYRENLQEQTLEELQLLNRTLATKNLQQNAPGAVLLVAFMRAIYEAQLSPNQRDLNNFVEILRPLTQKLYVSFAQSKNSSNFIFNKAAIEHLGSLQSYVHQSNEVATPVLDAVIELLNNVLTGCDAISFNAGVGASIGLPVTSDYSIYYSYYSWPKHSSISMSDIQEYGEILSSPEESLKKKIGTVFRYTKDVADFILLAKGLSSRAVFQRECVIPVTQELGNFYAKLGRKFVDTL